MWYRWRPAPSREPLPHGSLLMVCPCLAPDGPHWTLFRLCKAAPLPWAALSFLCTPGSPGMGPTSRDIPKSEKLRALRSDRHILDIRWSLPLGHYSLREERESSTFIQGSFKPTDKWLDLFSQPFRGHPRSIILLSREKDTRPQ